MTEPRTFEVNRLCVRGLVMILLGLAMSLSRTQRDDEGEALALMRGGCSTVFSGLLVAFPRIEKLLQRKDLTQ